MFIVLLSHLSMHIDDSPKNIVRSNFLHLHLSLFVKQAELNLKNY